MSPELYAKVTAAIWGFVLGAGIAMIIGFVWGGWTTATTTQRMSDEAVMTSQVSICVAQFMNGANNKARIKEFQGAENYQRGELIEKGGWDRMPGQEKATWGVASACVAGLEARIKTGA
jgi:hypothetical protein